MLQSVRSLLAAPQAYQLWWNAIGGPAFARTLVKQYAQAHAGDRVLEIGCGPGTIVRYLPDSEYLGFDLSSRYIELARKRYPKARFVCESVSQFSVAELGKFDLVLALGIVHHLDDVEARQLFQVAYDALRPGAKLVTVDGVWTEKQRAATRWLLSRDRGEHIRHEEEYVSIASEVFSQVRRSIRHDLLRIPYSHLILECVR